MEVHAVGRQKITTSRNQLKQGGQASFTGGGNFDMSKVITQSFPQKNTLSFMDKFGFLKGELGGILITALGTGLVAPIFIGFNPFVRAPKDATPEQKEDMKNTKLYTAMRQPISAVLAILFQASIQKYIDRGLDYIYNLPEYAKYQRPDLIQTDLNTETYIKSQVTKALKEENIEKPSLLRALINGKEGFTQRAKYDEIHKERVKNLQDEQVKKLAKVFEETGEIRINGQAFDRKTVAELVNSQIDSYIKDIDKLKKSDAQIHHYVNRAEILIKNEEHLRDIFKDFPLQEIKKTESKEELAKLYKQTEEKVRELLAKETNKDVKVLLKEILDRPDDLRANRIERTLTRLDSIKSMCNGKFTKAKYQDALHERNGVLGKKSFALRDAKIKTEEIANATTEQIVKAFNKAVDACHFKKDNGIVQSVLDKTYTFDCDEIKLREKISEDIAKLYKNFVKNSFKGVNQFFKIFIGVCITLPITCTALNWVYPRFMELFFPKLAGVKKDKTEEKIGGDKS